MGTDKTISVNESLRKFYRILRLDRKDISTIYFFAVLAGLVQLTLPLGIQTIISFVMAGSVSTSIVVLIGMVLTGTFLNGLLQVRQLQVIEKMKQKLFLRYSLEFSQRLPKLNLEKLDKYYLPELVNRFFDTFSLQKGLEKLLLDLPSAIIQIVLGLILLSFYHPVFIAFGLMLIIIILIIWKSSSARGLMLAYESSEYKYQVASWLQETARLVKSFKYTRGHSLHLVKTDKLVSGYLDTRTSFFRILLMQFWSLISFKILVTAAMLIAGTILLVNQQINVGQFIAADIVILAIISSVEKLIISLDKVYEAFVSVEKLGAITEADLETGGNIPMTDNGKGMHLRFDKVGFAYSGRDPVLSHISFEVKPGEMVHLKGNSGAGKSTLFRLLTGSYKNFTGGVIVDDVPIGNYELDSLRNQSGILLSSQDIFHGTLLENLSLGNPSVTIPEIMELAGQTGLKPYIQKYPEGLDTILDPVGSRLPGHLKTRILLIRALLGKHRLLLLEEPFQQLDSITTRDLISLLQSQTGTTVIIASQDDFISDYCKHVFVLENGQLTQTK